MTRSNVQKGEDPQLVHQLDDKWNNFKAKLTAMFETFVANMPKGDPSTDPNGKALTAKLVETKALVNAPR